jgi:hypothetical protein
MHTSQIADTMPCSMVEIQTVSPQEFALNLEEENKEDTAVKH